MTEAFLCDAIRTPIGRYGGALAPVRADDLGAVPLKALAERNRDVDWAAVDDVIYGCANQAGEDNRNVARMSLLLAGLPHAVPGATINRLCGSGMDAIGIAARAIKAGEANLMIAGGVESMSRAPFVTGKATSAFSRQAEIFDTTIGWRFVNPLMKQQYGVDSMPETAEHVATDYRVSRADQDAFALRSQQKAARAQADGTLAQEIVPVTIAQKKGEPLVVARDEHPRETTLDALAKLKGVVRPDGTVTAGNASGVNDGACALLVASEAAARRHGLVPRARAGDRDRGRRAAGDGDRPGAGDAEAARAAWHDARPVRRDRAERGVRIAGPGGAAAAGRRRRRCARESERRRDRARPSARRLGRAARDERDVSVASHRRPLRALHDVHRRRAGHRDRDRARVMRAAARRAAASLKRPALARAGPFVFSGLGGRPRRVPAPCVVRATNARRVRGPAGRAPADWAGVGRS
ncbi:acetyl-CoA C-acetyltransferase family protein [Burkholderia thailandensis USAMRU Malaysia |nr:acetyl-CoA C-acetyltransferase family protein [Burkholderia thailandensis USAMRU Malaysia \